MLLKRIALLMMAGALVSAATPVFADGTTQSNNRSGAAFARSGSAAGGDFSEFDAGASATSGGGSAAASQDGGNTGEISQESRQRSGDSAAGSTVSARTDGGSVQADNRSSGAFAATGAAPGVNVARGSVGPRATSLLGSSLSVQSGWNAVAAHQRIDGASGDAVAGSQTTGVLA